MDIVILGLFDGLIFNDVNIFLFIMIGLGALIGAFSKSLTIAVYSGFLIFIHIAVNVDVQLFQDAALSIVALFLLFLAFKLVSFVISENESDI